jgi:uncharacterized protein YbcC (UPF0753/DUF2309 family)
MNTMPQPHTLHAEALWNAALKAVETVAPAWPLQATVAVNPFLGHGAHDLAETAVRIGRLTGAGLFPARSWHRRRLSEGLMTRTDIALALDQHPVPGLAGPDDIIAALEAEAKARPVLPDVATLAAQASGLDWPRIVAERIAAFAHGYFDEGQALWTAERARGLYAGWRLFAMHDLTPEIAGLRGFAAEVAGLPLNAHDMVALAGERLGLGPDPGSYFEHLLLGLGGLAQYARRFQFVAARDGGSDGTILDLLAIRLAFDMSLWRLCGRQIGDAWKDALALHRRPASADRETLIDAVLLEAAELGEARRLASSLEWSGLGQGVTAEPDHARPWLQAAFCIDVRSEVFRRSLETLDEGLETLGFAGFFGLGVGFRASASDLVEHRLPVLLPAGAFACEAVEAADDRQRRFKARASRAFGRFRQAAVSSFAFVEASGLAYAGKLIKGSMRLAGKKSVSARPVLGDGWTLERRVQTAETILRSMSLTENFAHLVLLAGHGASSENNPYLSALQCGACGGHAGDVNARLLAALLNETDVREGVAAKGILIPADTVFLAGLHDTTTDEVTLFIEDASSAVSEPLLDRLIAVLKAAGRLARMERAKRLPRANSAPAGVRSRDWAETRAEWGLAGCSSFIAAPRSLTAGCGLGGRAFLHDYSWRKDEGFRVLELILTAPVVVANWINLQYYGSSVAPGLFGSGNKLLHNVVGGVGVVEGNGGPMRAGLPWQSVHDGERLMHEPLRLSVFVAAPAEAILDILGRHNAVRQLFDHGWMHLYRLDDAGGAAQRYLAGRGWVDMPGPFGPAADCSTDLAA